ncbi:MAG: hypothetical protein ACHQ50_14665 [Fimbriimonadales bacterium]
MENPPVCDGPTATPLYLTASAHGTENSRKLPSSDPRPCLDAGSLGSAMFVSCLLLATAQQNQVDVSSAVWTQGAGRIEVIGLSLAKPNPKPIGVDGKPLSGQPLATFRKAFKRDIEDGLWSNNVPKGNIAIAIAFRVSNRDIRESPSVFEQMKAASSGGGSDLETWIMSEPKGQPWTFAFDAPSGPWETIATFDESGQTSDKDVEIDLEKGSGSAFQITKEKRTDTPQDLYRGTAHIPKRYDGWRFDLTTDDPKPKVKPKNVDPMRDMLMAFQDPAVKLADRTELRIMGRVTTVKGRKRTFTLKGRPQLQVVFHLPEPK